MTDLETQVRAAPIGSPEQDRIFTAILGHLMPHERAAFAIVREVLARRAAYLDGALAVYATMREEVEKEMAALEATPDVPSEIP